MSKKFIEASELPDGERVYLRKDWLGWRTIEPYKIDGKINKFNLFLGGKRSLFSLTMIIVIVLLLFVGIKQLISSYEQIAENPCDFCQECHPNNEMPDFNFVGEGFRGDGGDNG